MLSLITPPDCLATYTAAAIAKADFWKTGWTGMRLGIVAYVVPFVFVFHSALIGRGTLGEIVVTMLTASIGVVLLGIGCVGYFFRPLSWSKRAWAFAATALLMMPPQARLPELAADAMGSRPVSRCSAGSGARERPAPQPVTSRRRRPPGADAARPARQPDLTGMLPSA